MIVHYTLRCVQDLVFLDRLPSLGISVVLDMGEEIFGIAQVRFVGADILGEVVALERNPVQWAVERLFE